MSAWSAVFSPLPRNARGIIFVRLVVTCREHTGNPGSLLRPREHIYGHDYGQPRVRGCHAFKARLILFVISGQAAITHDRSGRSDGRRGSGSPASDHPGGTDVHKTPGYCMLCTQQHTTEYQYAGRVCKRHGMQRRAAIPRGQL